MTAFVQDWEDGWVSEGPESAHRTGILKLSAIQQEHLHLIKLLMLSLHWAPLMLLLIVTVAHFPRIFSSELSRHCHVPQGILNVVSSHFLYNHLLKCTTLCDRPREWKQSMMFTDEVSRRHCVLDDIHQSKAFRVPCLLYWSSKQVVPQNCSPN